MLELVSKARTIRRFDTSKTITDADLMHVLECARRVASAGNLQRLRYVTINGEAAKSSFSNISLGGFLPPEKKPTEAVAPTAYVVISSYTDEPDANLLITGPRVLRQTSRAASTPPLLRAASTLAISLEVFVVESER